ncbi:hypothetical protein K439DRAFT_1630029 [Ramaria rubella]|nr:hypothetical protein K439DRAFT_1630029 [Ramaria rubella]
MALSHNLTTSERVRTVYQEIWHEFYDWEQEHCRQTLASLGSSSSSSSVADAPPKLPTQPVSEDLCTPTDQSTSQEIDCYRVQYYFDSDASTTETLSCSSYSCTTLEPVKPYEACTYSHKNLYIAEDYCEKLPFMPFADDPSFRAVEFFELYDSMGWDARKDPDIDIIAAEAARRLHFSYGISFEEIDKTGILPMSIIESPERKGLLRMLNQRDMLSWPGSILSDLPPLPLTEGPLLTALRKRVNGIRYFFCANLNCVEPYCPTHLNLDEQLKTPSNILVNDETERAKDLPCGYDCYKYIRDHTEGLTYWDETTTDDFKFILEGAADLSSCDLAILCDKPCREVYAHRQRYVTKAPDTTALSDESSDSTSDSYERPIFADIIRSGKPSDHLPPSEICQHAGRCDALADCRCYRKQLHCHRNCSCELSCKRRPKGCRCKHSGRKMCRTVKCPCWKAGRECDPELCRKCDAKGWRSLYWQTICCCPAYSKHDRR